jgi:DNA-binding transcriptional ArsR family regulator
MDLIITLCRALANPLRLCLLRAAHLRPGITVGDLCEQVGGAQPVVSKHLRTLADLALLDLRPSGRLVHIHPPPRESGRGALIDAISGLLARTWKVSSEGNSTHSNVWNCLSDPECGSPADLAQACQRMVLFFTAYTHLRRLLILRHVAVNGPTSQEALADEIGMSAPAASRQLTKLERRHLVRRAEVDGQQKWALLPELPAPFQAHLHRLVTEQLVRGAGS